MQMKKFLFKLRAILNNVKVKIFIWLSSDVAKFLSDYFDRFDRSLTKINFVSSSLYMLFDALRQNYLIFNDYSVQYNTDYYWSFMINDCHPYRLCAPSTHEKSHSTGPVHVVLYTALHTQPIAGTRDALLLRAHSRLLSVPPPLRYAEHSTDRIVGVIAGVALPKLCL